MSNRAWTVEAKRNRQGRSEEKCDFTKSSMCCGMEAFVQGPNYKGLVVQDVFNKNTGKRLYSLVYYKNSATDAGLLLNLCPWCGYDLEKYVDEARAQGLAAK